MKDIIYREDAIDKLTKWELDCVWDSWTLEYKDDPKEHIVAPTDVIKNLPSAERTGKWINVLYGLGADDAECSNCHKRTRMIPSRNADGVSVDFSFHKFCPHCGTRMVSE